MEYNFDLEFPGEFEFRAPDLKIEWRNGKNGGEDEDAETVEETLRQTLYSRIIARAASKELDSLAEAVKKAGFSSQKEQFLLFKIEAFLAAEFKRREEGRSPRT